MKKTITVMLMGLLWAVPAEAQLQQVTVLLDWFVNPDHAPLIVAREKGYFEKAEMAVKLIAPANPNDPPKLVAAKKADLAVSYQPQHHLHVDQGLPIVRVGTLVATPLNSLVVLDDGPIKTLADLKAKTIGYSIGGFEDVLLKILLGQVGLTLDDVKLVNVNFSLSPSLLTGRTDAVIGAFRNFELNQMDIENHPGRAFFVEEHGIPPYDELILIAHKERAREPFVGAFIDAVEKGVQFLLNHPEESWQLLAQSGKDLDNELNRRAFQDTLPRFALRPGALDRRRYQRFAQFLHQEKMITQVPKLSRYAIAP